MSTITAEEQTMAWSTVNCLFHKYIDRQPKINRICECVYLLNNYPPSSRCLVRYLEKKRRKQYSHLNECITIINHISFKETGYRFERIKNGDIDKLNRSEIFVGGWVSHHEDEYSNS